MCKQATVYKFVVYTSRKLQVPKVISARVDVALAACLRLTQNDCSGTVKTTRLCFEEILIFYTGVTVDKLPIRLYIS